MTKTIPQDTLFCDYCGEETFHLVFSQEIMCEPCTLGDYE